MATKQPSELTVITKSKDLCSYIMTVTQKSPKHFRYTFVNRMQNLSLDIVEKLIRANKSEIELLMFSIFMDEMIDHNLNDQKVLDYKSCSDYKMSEMLGIPKEKVKTLKIKKQARYPREFNWRKSLDAIKNSILYDSDKKRIIIPVNDPNLYLSIKNYIEEQDGYIEIQRGSNVLQMRPSHFFILLFWGIENDEEKQKVKKNFIKELNARNEDENLEITCDDKIIVEKAMGIFDDTLDFFENVVEGINNPTLLIIKAIRTIGKVARRK